MKGFAGFATGTRTAADKTPSDPRNFLWRIFHQHNGRGARTSEPKGHGDEEQSASGIGKQLQTGFPSAPIWPWLTVTGDGGSAGIGFGELRSGSRQQETRGPGKPGSHV